MNVVKEFVRAGNSAAGVGEHQALEIGQGDLLSRRYLPHDAAQSGRRAQRTDVFFFCPLEGRAGIGVTLHGVEHRGALVVRRGVARVE